VEFFAATGLLSSDPDAVNQVSRQPRASGRSWNIANWSLPVLAGYYSASAGWAFKRASERALCSTSGTLDVSVACQGGGSRLTLPGIERLFYVVVAACALILIRCEIKRTFIGIHSKTFSSSL
jgi:hypothetical protein